VLRAGRLSRSGFSLGLPGDCDHDTGDLDVK
jgi:hypothetical protein